jgi:hypothetical protein
MELSPTYTDRMQVSIGKKKIEIKHCILTKFHRLMSATRRRKEIKRKERKRRGEERRGEERRGEEKRREEKRREEKRREEKRREEPETLGERDERGKRRARKGTGGKRVREREKGQRNQGGPNIPFYSKPGLPGCYQLTVGWSLKGKLTVWRWSLTLNRS